MMEQPEQTGRERAVEPARPDLLETIVAATRRIVTVRGQREPTRHLERRAMQREPRPGVFRAALTRPDAVNVIAECKRRSPSRGVLRPAYDPVAIARGYAEAGASAISVLTEPTFFDGDLHHLEQVRAAVDIPLLRKDFIVTDYQLLEARAAGADAVLLIAGALERDELARLRVCAASLGLDALVEVHDAAELDVALAAGAGLIGVNNRNLRTLQVDVAASEALAARIPPDRVAVSESGLKSVEDLARLRRFGYRAFLIGERFMLADDPGQALRQLLASC
jgi:indole-3-glycerol phosphate synthase